MIYIRTIPVSPDLHSYEHDCLLSFFFGYMREEKKKRKKKQKKKNYVLIKDILVASASKAKDRHDNGWYIITRDSKCLAPSFASISTQEFWWHSVIASLIGIFHVFLRVIYCDSWSCKPQKGRKMEFWRLKFGHRICCQFHTLASTFFSHRTRAIRPSMCRFGPAILMAWPLNLGVRPPNSTGLYKEKCVFRIRVHEFWDLRHILEQKLCRFGGHPS